MRIGEESHGYYYERVDQEGTAEGTVYVCCRGSILKGKQGTVLWLRLSPALEWIAFDAPQFTNDDGTLQVPEIGEPIFSSQENILLGGSHVWKLRKYPEPPNYHCNTYLPPFE